MGKNLSQTVLRISFIAVFGVAGFLLGREAYLSVFSPHFASEAMQLAFLVGSPVAGALLGALTAPIAQALFEGQLSIAEGAIDR